MTNPSVSRCAEALGSALELIEGLNVIPYLSDTFTPPVALIGIDTINYHGSFGLGDVEQKFQVHLILARSDVQSGIEAMESYMSPSGDLSIREALESDQTLGGVVSSLVVTGSGPPTNLTINGAVYIDVPFDVTVHA